MRPNACFLEILVKAEQAPIQRGVYMQIELILWEAALNDLFHCLAVWESQRTVIGLLKFPLSLTTFFSCIAHPVPESDEELGLMAI